MHSLPKERTATQKFIGKSLEALTLAERWTLSGLWVARALYSPDRLPLRIMAAIGESSATCMQQLKVQGLNPALYEYERLPQPTSRKSARL